MLLRMSAPLRSLCAVAVLLGIVGSTTGPASAQGAGSATIVGSLIDQANGLPVSNARLDLYQGEKDIANTTSDSNGTYTFTKVVPGSYYVEIHASGYEAARSEDIFLLADTQTQVRSTLVHSLGKEGLHVIAAVRAQRTGLQTSSVITERIPTAKILSQGIARVGDALLELPGITANDLDSAPGDDLHINIRGMKGSETAALLDGHPIGPIGVGNGQRGGYNYQLSPAWGLSDTQVSYGTGGLALYGINTVGGAVNFQTLDITSKATSTFMTGAGSLGRKTTVGSTSGTFGRIGYVAAYGVQGIEAPFSPQAYTQNALLVGPGTGVNNTPYVADVSPANVQANTWPVSGNYVLRSGLAKLQYEINPTTNLTFTAYNATSWDDKTGQGDNDAWSADYAGAFFDQNAGGTPGCSGVYVKVDNTGNVSCYNRNQFVSAFTGPAGGTPVAWQGLRNQDYSLRLRGTGPDHVTTATIFADTFNVLYDRNFSGTTNNYQTLGEQITNDFISANNDLGVGVYAYDQSEIDGNFSPAADVRNPAINQSFFDYFARDTWNASSRLSFMASAWVNQNSVTNSTAVSPRFTVMYKPTARDVVRLSGGSGQGVPAIGLLHGAASWSQPGAITTPACAGLTSVVNSSNPTLKPEKSTDVEFSYGHRFGPDSNIQMIAYDTNETNVIFSSIVPLSSIGVLPGPGDPSINDYVNAIIARCGANAGITAANLGASTSANAGAGRYRGIDFTGRQRATRYFFVDYGYSILSSRLFDIPALTLKNNLTLVPGGQIDKVPIHQANLGFDYASPGGFEVRLDEYYVGNNNGLLRPAYTYGNASIAQHLSNGVTLNLGIYNVFNSQYDQFGRIGLGTFQPENQYGTDANVLQQALSGADGERFGMPQRSFLFTVSTKV